MTNQSYTPSTNGLQSYVDASPEYELAPIGIASMQDQAQKLAEMGRNGDIYVIHAAQGETVIPMEVLEANPQIKALLFNQMAEMGLDPQRYVVGDQLNSLNPVTGMPEFFFSSIFKGIKKAVKSVAKVVKEVAPVALPFAAMAFGIPGLPAAWFGAGKIGAAVLSSGIGSLIAGKGVKGALKDAVKAGLTAGIFSALKGATPPSWNLGGTGGWAGAKRGLGSAIYDPTTPTATDIWGHLTGGPGDLSDRAFDVITGQVKSPAAAPLKAPLPVKIDELPPPKGYVSGQPWLDQPTAPSLFDTAAIRPSNVDVNRLIDPSLDYPSELNLPGGALAGGRYGANLAGDGVTSRIGMGSGWDIPGAPLSRTGELPTLKPNQEWSMVGRSAAEGPIVVEKGFSLGTGEGPWGLPGTGNKLADYALYGTAGYGALKYSGALEEAEGDTDKEIRKASEEALAGRRVIDPKLVLASQIATTTPGVEDGVYIPGGDVLQPTIFNEAGEYIGARGGSVNYPERDLLVEGPGTEKSDDIPAMLSDGEFVINSKAVRGADPSGRGNRYAGAQNLYNLMRNFEMRA